MSLLQTVGCLDVRDRYYKPSLKFYADAIAFNIVIHMLETHTSHNTPMKLLRKVLNLQQSDRTYESIRVLEEQTLAFLSDLFPSHTELDVFFKHITIAFLEYSSKNHLIKRITRIAFHTLETLSNEYRPRVTPESLSNFILFIKMITVSNRCMFKRTPHESPMALLYKFTSMKTTDNTEH